MMAWRLSRALACAALLLAAVVSAMPAVAADNDWDACVNGWGDFAIEPCTSAIKSGKYKDHDLAVLYVNRGILYQDVGDLDRAMADLTEAIRLDPKYAEAYYNRGEVWLDAREFDRAIADYSEAIRLDPKHAKAYVGRGVTWQRKGDLDRAIADFTEAIRLDPNYAAAYREPGRRLVLQRGLRPRHCGLHRGDPPRSEACAALQRSRHRVAQQVGS
jgi:tetratricopeptide (TPR) repeat protein